MAALVGRERELARLRQGLDAARAGNGSALVVTGDAGIGKSTLLQALEEDAAPSCLVLRTTGRESERELPYAALSSLVEPLLHLLPSLPDPQAAALRSALALEQTVVADPFAVAVATHGLLAGGAAERPLLCIVDDVHWLDASSAAALLFAAHRFGDLPAFAVLAARDGEPQPRGLDALPALPVQGLSETEGLELLERDADHVIDGRVARELIGWTGGNPLALLELQTTLDEARRLGRIAVEEPVRVGKILERLFLRRIEALPAETRGALLRAAADGQAPPDAAALEPAERAGIVELREGRVEFAHPLMRAAVYHGTDEPDRRRAHADLAQTVPAGDPSPRRALHLARAATGPDEDVARALELSARGALGRGAVGEAATLFELAAGLSPTPAAQTLRLAEAASALVFSGEPDRAGEALDRAARASDDVAARVAVDRVRGVLLLWSGDVMGAHRILAEAGERAAPFDRSLAAAVVGEAVWAAMTAAEIRVAAVSAQRAAELADGLGGVVENMTRSLLLRVQVIAGSAGTHAEAAEHFRALVPPEPPLEAAGGYALTLVWLEEFDAAATILEEALRRARAAGALTTIPLLLAIRCELATWRGDLRSALAAGLEAEQLCAQLGSNVAYPYVLSVLARAEAVAGRADAAEAHARAALDFSRPRGIASIEIYAACALGALELGRGAYAEAVARLEPLRAFYAERGIGEPNSMPWLGDLAEAATLAGDEAIADGALGDLDAMAARTGSRWAAGVAARARALREPLETAAAELDQATALLAGMPFELARVDLVRGELLRRARRRAEARMPLREALHSFERIGAEQWADRARRELAAAGGVVADRGTRPESVLSPQELQVALLVAEGLTNREAAARLIVSPKTIEYHLGNAFRKLGVRSRVELVKRLESA